MSDHLVIVGGSGFIGSAITRGCSRDGCVCVPLGSRDCDLTDREACMEYLPRLLDGNVVVYAAGIPRSRADTPDVLQANLAMVNNVVAAAREVNPSRMIFISSVEVYGIPDKLPITEDTRIDPVTSYGSGKHQAELALQNWHKDTGVPLAILRFPGVYGPGDKGRSIVGKLVESARGGKPFRLLGEGSWKRDYVLVDDIARVVTALAKEDFEELIFNVATGRSFSICEVIDMVEAEYGPVPLKVAEETGPDGHLEFNISNMKAALPALEMTGLEEGLRAYGDSRDV